MHESQPAFEAIRNFPNRLDCFPDIVFAEELHIDGLVTRMVRRLDANPFFLERRLLVSGIAVEGAFVLAGIFPGKLWPLGQQSLRIFAKI